MIPNHQSLCSPASLNACPERILRDEMADTFKVPAKAIPLTFERSLGVQCEGVYYNHKSFLTHLFVLHSVTARDTKSKNQ